jgi:hypothetical protein
MLFFNDLKSWDTRMKPPVIYIALTQTIAMLV